MRNYRKIFFSAVLIFIFLVTGCTPSSKAYIAEDRNEKWVNDLDYVEKVLPKVHKNLYFKITEKEFISQLEELKKKVPTYSDEEIEIELSKVVASVGDTHSGSSIGSQIIYPMDLYWFSEGIYIVNTSEEYKELLDAQIITINGKKIEDAAKAIRPLLGASNESWFKTQVIYYLQIPSVLKYFKIIQDDEIELSVKLTTGEVKDIKMNPIHYEEYVQIDRSDRKVPLYQTHPYENYWYEYLENEKILYFNYRSCRQMREKPFEIFSKELWDFVGNHEIEKFVVDIRDNRGGSSPILNPFIKKLAKSSFNEEGKLYVVIGRDTYSSAVLNAMTIKNKTKAYFVGEETGGSPNHYGEVKKFELPNSKKPIRYSTKYFKEVEEDIDTIKPNKLIEETFEDYKNCVDPVLQWIIEEK